MHKKSDMHDYQSEMTTGLYENEYVLIICPMGGGKTAAALTAIKELLDEGEIRSCIVVAPKRVANTVWPDELLEWEHLKDLTMNLIAGKLAARRAALEVKADIHVVSFDHVQWLVKQMKYWAIDDPRFDLLAIDEISRFKDHASKRGHDVNKVAPLFSNRWGLTGTPMPNSEIDLWGPARVLSLNTVWPEPFGRWRNKHFIAEDYMQYNWEIREEHKQKIWDDIKAFSISIDPERLPGTPDVPPIVHWIDMPKNMVDQYRSMERKLFSDMRDGTILAENMAVATGKLEQLTQGFIYDEGKTFERLNYAKLEMMEDLVAGAGGSPVLGVYHFKEDLLALRSRWKKLRYLGKGVSDKESVSVVKDWNANKIPLLAVHPASAGHGLNLQKGGANQIIHYHLTWSAENYAQVNARLARQGNKSKLIFNHLIAMRGTIDEIKIDRVVGKLSAQKAFAKYLESK